MHTVTLDGKEYTLRCDLNVAEQIEEKYGSLGGLQKQNGSASALKFLTAAMINEHYKYTGSSERVTEDFVGARLTMADRVPVMNAVLACLGESITPKNA